MLKRYLVCFVKFSALEVWISKVGISTCSPPATLVLLTWEMRKCEGKICGRIWEGCRAEIQDWKICPATVI